jgi:hypothetical protein
LSPASSAQLQSSALRMAARWQWAAPSAEESVLASAEAWAVVALAW